jgi:hypothetical protein
VADERKVIKTVVSGFTSFVEKVDLYDSTLAHIEKYHPEEYKRLPEIIATIEGSATRIHKSKTHPTSIVLVNDNVTSSADGDPLRLPIKIYDDKSGILSTAHFTSSTDQGPLLWSKKT